MAGQWGREVQVAEAAECRSRVLRYMAPCVGVAEPYAASES
jgi:hypothetical protein